MESFSKEQLTATTAVQDINGLVHDPNVVKIYGNGFTFGFSLSDASIVVQMGPVPVAMLSLSLTSLKTLAVALNDTITQIEANIGEPIKSIQEIKQNISNRS